VEIASKPGVFGPVAKDILWKPDGNAEITERILNVYPNHATSVLNIDYDKAPYNVFLFNSIGILVQSEVSENPSFKMNVGQLNKGLYLIRIQDNENNVVTKKVLIE